jgi:hypothetical protein
MTVRDSHTFFVGKPEWNFALWVHNAGFCPVTDAARKITKGKWGKVISDYNTTAIEHIRQGHFARSRPGLASSRFSARNSHVGRVKELVNEAIANGEHVTSSGGQYRVTYTFDEVIGTDMMGRKTKSILVYLDEAGNIKNAFPITTP